VAEEPDADVAEPAVTRDGEPGAAVRELEAAVEQEAEAAVEEEAEAAVERAPEAAVERQPELAAQNAPGAVITDPEPETREQPEPVIAEGPEDARQEGLVEALTGAPPKRGWWARLFRGNAARARSARWTEPQVGDARPDGGTHHATGAISDPDPTPPAQSDTSLRAASKPPSFSAPDPRWPYPATIAASRRIEVAPPTPESEPDLDGRAPDPETAAAPAGIVGPESLTALPDAGSAASQGETASSQSETAASQRTSEASQPSAAEPQFSIADPEFDTGSAAPVAAPDRTHLDAARAQAALDQVLDVLGAAHHRPFSRA
jgi:hypothetical protein